MKVTSESTILDLHNYFSALFPFLKIEVYKGKHKESEGSPQSDQLDHSTKLIDISPALTNKILHITKDMKVSEFESLMLKKFKLNVQVFRKSNEIWLQTSVTDDWTLEKQNGKGERSQLNLYTDTMDKPDLD